MQVYVGGEVCFDVAASIGRPDEAAVVGVEAVYGAVVRSDVDLAVDNCWRREDSGGGVKIPDESPVLDKIKAEGDEATGVAILKKAVEEPVRWIAINAGQEGSVVVDKVKKSKKGVGYDANKDAYVNMVEKGIIDPLKVTRTALENASSIANMILTTEALVTDIPEKEKTPPMPQMPDYGM